ncbi:uncharacterized protein METZ01_LOCUS315918 [marine metagenome]|uniref:Uncharacterized protein n=1 Tax=marine metagenome TaxID=408172 RepID=A0A382NPF7_9ZZZZ
MVQLASHYILIVYITYFFIYSFS